MAKKVLTQSTVATNNIQSQADQVKDQSAALKLAFDQYGIDSKAYNNNTLLTELQSETLNDSGAHAIGLKTANSVADNVADEIDLIRQAGSGTIPPDDSITLPKQNSTVKTGLLADLNTTDKTTFKDAINEVDLNTDRNTDAIQYGNTVTGTDTLVITTPTGDFTFAVGKVLRGVAVNNNTGAMTANPDGDGALPIKKLDGSSYVDVEADDFEDNKPFELIGQNDGVIGDFFLQAPRGGAIITRTADSYAVSTSGSSPSSQLSVTNEGFLLSVNSAVISTAARLLTVDIDSAQVLPQTNNSIQYNPSDTSFMLKYRFNSSFNVKSDLANAMIAYSIGNKDIAKCVPKFFINPGLSSSATLRKSENGKGVITGIWADTYVGLKIDGIWVIGNSASDCPYIQGELVTEWYYNTSFEFYTDSTTIDSTIIFSKE